jgi:glycosyltransferase involved in cell wall biosynthesis
MRVALVTNTDFNLYNFRLPIARAARARGAEVVLICPDGDYAERMRAEGFRHRAIRVDQGGTNPFRDGALAAQLLGIYQRERPDLVHHFSAKAVIYGTAVARLLGIRAVNSVPGMGYAFGGSGRGRALLRALMMGLYRAILTGGSGPVVFQTRDDLEFFVRRIGLDPTRARLIRGSGVDPTRFRPRPELRETSPVVLFASRLLADKGVREFCQAAAIVRGRGIDARFWLAGAPRPGHPDSVGEAEIERWRSEGNVEVLGHRDDMEALMARAWFLVLPTAYGEGVPRVLLEAAAMELAIVASDVPGVREVLEDGVTGVAVPARSPEGIADAIQRLISHPAERAAYAAAARELVVREFDERAVVARTIELYEEARHLTPHAR